MNFKKSKLLLAFVLVVSLLMAVGCTNNAEETATDSNKSIYFIPIHDTGAYWGPIAKAAEDMANELGYDLVLKTSPPGDPQENEKHIGFFNEAIQNKAAGIAVAPMDPDMFDKKAAEATEAGIPVVTFDADVKSKENRVAYVGTDNYKAGKELGKKGAELLKEKGVEKGKIALVATNLTQTTMTERRDGIREGFEEIMGDKAKQFKWLEEIQDDDQAAESKRQLESQITANPDMVAVFSLGSEGPDTGVMEALKSQNKGGKILHFGFDYTPTWENGIEEKLITGIVDQDSYSIGKTVIDVLIKKIEGEEVDDNYPIEVKWIDAEDIMEYGKEKEKMIS